MHNCFATKGRLLGALKNQGCLCTGLASTKGILPGVWYSGEDPMCVCVYVDNRWQLCVWIRIYHAYCVYMIYTFWQNACLFVCLLACLFTVFLQSTACISSFLTDQLSFRSDGCERRWCSVTWRVRGYEVSEARRSPVDWWDWCIATSATSAQNGGCNKNGRIFQQQLFEPPNIYINLHHIGVWLIQTSQLCKEKRCC